MRLRSTVFSLIGMVAAFGCERQDPCRQAGRPIPDDALLLERLNGVVDFSGAGDELPWFVSPVGDVNGDGPADLLISTAGDERRRAYVVYGGAGLTSGTLEQAVAQGGGLVLAGAPADATTTGARTPIGDVNGDGFGDVGLGGSRDPLTHRGHAFVVFGGVSAAAVDLAALVEDGRGMRISSDRGSPGQIGHAMTSAGDADGDGVNDIFVLMSIGESIPDPEYGDTYEPRSYEVWRVSGGAARALTLETDAGARRVLRSAEDDGNQPYLLGAGDLDGDGRADLAIGDPQASATRGRLYLISAAALDVTGDVVPTPSELVAGGLASVIEGPEIGDGMGFELASVGDLDRDGLADVAVGASRAQKGRGQIAVVFGSPQVWSTSYAKLEQNDGGFLVTGEEVGDHLRFVGGGDIDGDGVSDLLVGSDDVSLGTTYASAAYVLRGSTGWAERRLGPGVSGLVTIAGSQACGLAGGQIVSLGDVTADQIDDFAMMSYRREEETAELIDVQVHVVSGRSAW